MDLTELIRSRAADLVDEATAELHQARLQHYEQAGEEAIRERLAELLARTLRCLRERRADAMVEYAAEIARARYAAGYDLFEVQTSINVLEEALWKRILAAVGPEELGQALGLVNALFGLAKDTLACTFVAAATQSDAPRGETEQSPPEK